ncbi:hypothetical protein CCAX7_10880 [Capsulimonas corticalis]|uniref:Uncharacterized protein n=1 Tax=Capsulimonas corticalis TaxID=2219043 RepID=A0A402CUP7_9BACT|nr:hypothetical protein [Capsulimonas corticalis]BDI29037.1 hypothetical protein CCAX7_10880 [Capsulimonas corticalis]
MDEDIEILMDPAMVAQGYILLMQACSRENYAAVVDQLQNGADVNADSKYGRSALLLDHGTDINAHSFHELEYRTCAGHCEEAEACDHNP